MQLINWLGSMFPGLTLEPPLFYRWSVSLRFELNVDSPNGPRLDIACRRARALYEAVFQPTDVCYVVSVDDRFCGIGRYKLRRFTLFDLAKKKNIGIGRPSGRGQLRQDGDVSNSSEHTTVRMSFAEISPRRINYPDIIGRIAHRDFGRGPVLTDRVYFVNLSREIILHMYDDRGMDLIATNGAALQLLYVDHHDWLLPYDLEIMDKNFR